MKFQIFSLLKKNEDKLGKLGDVLTLGRFGNYINKKIKISELENNKYYSEAYSEQILKCYFLQN